MQETVSSRLNCGRKQLRDLLFEHLAFYAGVGAMAVWGSWNCPLSLRWWWVTRFFNAQHNKVLKSLGEASKWSSCNILQAGAVLVAARADLAS